MEGISQLAKSIANSVEVLPLIYKDLAQPGVQKVGKALETVLDLSNTLLLPVKLANEKTRYWFDKNMESYKSKLDSTVADEKICDVPPEIGIPILDKLTYTTNDDIADLFTTLLAKASSSETANQAHPKFVSIISSLSTDEAKIIKHIKTDILYADLRIYVKEREGFNTVGSYLTGLEFQLDLTFPENTSTYFQNLVTLGLFTDMGTVYKIDKEGYEKLHNMYAIDILEVTNSLEGAFDRVEWKNSYFRLNSFGKMFINACKM